MIKKNKGVKKMKVFLINGSPNKNGCVNEALDIVSEELNKQDVETEKLWIGNKPVRDCIACDKCREKGGFCVFTDDCANDIAKGIIESDGVIIGSPVYFGGACGALCALLDRAFYHQSVNLRNKPGAAVISSRRAGSTSAFDRINKYFTIYNMPIVPSQYWNEVHGFTPEDVRKDLEGVQTMQTLAKNMAWMIKALEDKEKPSYEDPIYTNFIR